MLDAGYWINFEEGFTRFTRITFGKGESLRVILINPVYLLFGCSALGKGIIDIFPVLRWRAEGIDTIQSSPAKPEKILYIL